jgi:hypothetical protein
MDKTLINVIITLFKWSGEIWNNNFGYEKNYEFSRQYSFKVERCQMPLSRELSFLTLS